MTCKENKSVLKPSNSEEDIERLAEMLSKDLFTGRTSVSDACKLIDIIIKG